MYLQADDENYQTRLLVRLLVPARARPHPAQPARRTYRWDAWQCIDRSVLEWREYGCNHRAHRSRCPAYACYTPETPDHKSSSTACAATDCLRQLPCCAVAGSLRRATPGSKPDNAS